MSFEGKEEQGYEISHFILGGEYFLLAVFAMVVWIHTLAEKQHPELQHPMKRKFLKSCFYFFLIIGCISRTVYFVLIVFVENGTVQVKHINLFTLINIPTLFFVTAETVVLIAWTRLFYKLSNKKPHFLLKLPSVVFINAVLYFICFFFLLIDVLVYPEQATNTSNTIDGAASTTWAESVVTSCIGVCYLLLSLLFFLYGIRVYLFYRANVTQRIDLNLKVSVLAIFVPVMYFFRIPVIVGSLFYSFSGNLWWFDLPYYSIFELLPLLLLLIVLKYRGHRAYNLTKSTLNYP